MASRIARALGTAPDDPVVGAFAEQLSASRFTIAAWQRRWLPGLEKDLQGSAVAEAGAALGPDLRAPAGASGWYVDPDTASITYRPTGHPDPLLQSWIAALMTRAIESAGAPGGESDENTMLRAELRERLFRDLIAKEGGGFLYRACLRCHVVESNGNGARATGVRPVPYCAQAVSRALIITPI